ncbi:MAG: DMT family transporter [Candidatus Thorarchaeota archaeon]
MAYIYILAIFLGILSYSLLNVGMGLQKKAAAELPKIDKTGVGKNFKNFFTNKTWLIGFSMVQIQWIFLTLALDLAPISVITPLMSVGMVTLVIFSYFYLKEKISRIEIIGIIAIIIGIVILGITNPETEVTQNLVEICACFAGWEGIVFLSISFVLSIGLLLLSILRKYKNADILFGISAGITDALGAVFLKAVMGGADFNDASVLKASVVSWEWWTFMIIMIIFNGTATIYLQVAYQRGKAVIVAPIFSVFAMLTPVLAGVIIFNDWAILIIEGTVWKLILKMVSLIVIVAGAIILSLHSARKEQKELVEDEELETLTQDEIVIEENLSLESEEATIHPIE